MFTRTLFLVALATFLSGCGDKIEPGNSKRSPAAPFRVSISTARIVDHPLFYEAVATVQAGFTANLSSKIVASVKEVRVKESDRVKRGEKLVLLDQAQALAAFNQAEAVLGEAGKGYQAALSGRDAARSAKELASATYERYQNLKKTSSVGSQEFDEVEARRRQADAALLQAEAAVEAASARIKQAEAALKSARIALDDTIITAPYEGIITARQVDEGVLATPAMPLLTIETTQGYRVDMILSETHIEHVRPRQKVLVKIPAVSEEPIEGTIATIVPSADERSRSFLIKVALPSGSQVMSGMFARVQIPLGRTSPLLVSGNAIMTRGQLTGIYLLDSEKIVHFRLIRTGRVFGDSIEVLSGMKEGDRYVENPPLDLVDDARVEVIP
jgi:RND family efflux transporter MFP subunit